MALHLRDEHIGTTIVDLDVQRQLFASQVNPGRERFFLAARRPETGRARVISMDLEVTTGNLRQRDAIETSFPVVSSSVAMPGGSLGGREVALAALREDKRVVVQGLAVAGNGDLSGRFSQELDMLADEIRFHGTGDPLVLAARQGSSVSLSLWRFAQSGVQRSSQPLLRQGLGELGEVSGSHADMVFAARLSDQTFRMESLGRTAGGDFVEFGSMIESAGLRLFNAAGFAETTAGSEHFRRVAVVATTQGPTGVRTGLFGNHRLLVDSGVLVVGIYGKDGGIVSPVRKEAEVGLDGWFGLAGEASVVRVSGEDRIVTAHKGRTTFETLLSSNRGKPVARLIERELVPRGGAGSDLETVSVLKRVDSVDISGDFRALHLLAPRDSRHVVLAMIDDQSRLRVRSVEVRA